MVARVLVALAVAVQALALSHELAIGRVDLNDNLFHLRLTERVAETLESGGNPFDFWVSEWSLGYPVTRTYQPLGHLAVASVWLTLGKQIELETLFLWARYLLICLWPLTVYLCARGLRFSSATAVAAALVAPLVATQSLFGLEYGSYLWRGSGLFTQSLAMHLLAASLALAYRALATGRHLTPAGVMLGLTFLAHFIYGYIAALSVVLLALLEAPRVKRLARTAFAGTVALTISLFHLLPLLLDSPQINRSRWEPAWKWDSYGAREVLEKLATGELLDAGRLPVLSLLALIGAVIAWRGSGSVERDAGERFALAGAVLWLMLYFGRPTWGEALRLLGISEMMHLHRLLGGVHLFLVLLAGVGLGGLWALAARRGRAATATATLIALAWLYPAAAERWHYLEENRRWGRQNLEAHQREGPELAAALAYARTEPGRIFPGLGGGWGKDFRVGWVPLHGHLARDGTPAVSYLYHAMALTSDIMVHFNEWQAEHYRLFNVSTVLAPADRRVAAFLTPAAGAGRFQLYRAPASGWFELVDVPDTAIVDRHSFYDINRRWLDSGWLAARQHLRLDFATAKASEAPTLEPPEHAARRRGKVAWQDRRGEVYRARVSVDRPAHLLFKMTYHRNWRVSINGEPAETMMLTPGFLGVALAPGGYEVECRYRPEGWRTLLLWFAMPLVGLAVWTERKWARTTCAPTART